MAGTAHPTRREPTLENRNVVHDLPASSGSVLTSRSDPAWEHASLGHTRVITSTQRLEDVNECFEEVLSGRAPARLVLEIEGNLS